MARKTRKRVDHEDDPKAFDKAMELAKEIFPKSDVKLAATLALFVYLHWKAWGAGPLPTKWDLVWGVAYALTVPPALAGGILANTYALGVLGALGLGFVPADVWEAIAESPEAARQWFLSQGIQNPWNWYTTVKPGEGTIKPVPPPQEASFNNFVNGCHLAGGAVNPVHEYGQPTGEWECSVYFGGQLKRSYFYADFVPCFDTGGTWDFINLVCNVPTSKI